MSKVAEEGYEVGIGGKLRTRQHRRKQVTPYDLPAAAARVLRGDRADAAVEGQGSRWISKLVDPASTLIIKGATRLFTSVFRKRLGSLPVDESPVASFEPRGAASDICDDTLIPEVQKQASGYRAGSRNHSYGDGISELEQLLKQKTFTRAEYDHLMDLLHSRTVDVPKEDENKRIESSTLLPVDDHKKKEEESLPPQESRIDSSGFIGITLTPGSTLKILDDELASPAEVAKAYMCSRSSKVSPSLCLRSRMFREAAASPSFIGSAPKSSAAPICSKSVVCFSGVPGTLGDGYVTPRPRGRLAIYKMSRSPYFKGQPTITLKDGEPMESGYTGPSVSTQTPMNVPLSSGKQVLKRRYVSESEVRCVGPIRKVRQMSNLASSSDVISQHPGKPLSTENALVIVQRSSSSIQRPHPLLECKYVTSNMRKRGNQGERSVYASTPLQSREMAEKILQQLDKLVPSPKGESAEGKTSPRDESPPKLTLDMLDGQAFKSVSKIDASQLFSVEANGKLEDSNNFHAASPRSSISPVKGKTENGYSRSTFSGMKMATKGKGVDSFVASIAETGPLTKSVDSVLLHSTVGPQQIRPAFKMQAPEDSLEQVDGSYIGRDISGPSPPGKEKLEMNDHKSVISETAVIKKTFASSSMSGSNIQLSQVAGKGDSDGPAVADKASGSTFQISLPLSSQCQAPMTPTMPSSSVEEPVPSTGQNSVPLFTFGSKSSPLIFSSSMMSSSDPAGQKYGANTDFKGQFFGSSTTESTTIAPVECTKSGEAGKTQMAGDLSMLVGTLSSFGLPMSPSSGSS